MASKKPAVSAKSAASTLKGEESTAVTTVNTSRAVSSALPTGIRLKRVITVPSLAIKTPGEGRVLTINDEMRVSKVIDKEKKPDGTPKREPATVCTVTDPTTGEQFIFITPAVVKENLQRDYPDNGYIGKTFYIQNLGKRTESQRYNDYGIAEVELEPELAD